MDEDPLQRRIYCLTFVESLEMIFSQYTETCEVLLDYPKLEGSLLSETRKYAEISDEYDDNSMIPPLLSEEEMDAMDSGDESDHDLISTEMLKDIRDGGQTHPNVNRRKYHYKIRDHIRQRKSEWKGELKAT